MFWVQEKYEWKQIIVKQFHAWNSQSLTFPGNAVAYCGRAHNVDKCYCQIDGEKIDDPAKNPKCAVFGDMFTKGPGPKS